MVMPVFMLLLLGLWEIGWSQHAASRVRHALSQASRQITLDPDMTEAEAQTFVRGRLTAIDEANVTVSLSKATNASGVTMATLVAAYPHSFTLPGAGEFGFTYHSTVTTPLPTSVGG